MEKTYGIDRQLGQRLYHQRVIVTIAPYKNILGQEQAFKILPRSLVLLPVSQLHTYQTAQTQSSLSQSLAAINLTKV